MSSATERLVPVRVELPLSVTDQPEREPEDLAGELRLLWILNEVRAHRLSQGKGTRLADMTRQEFMELMGSHGIPAIDLSTDELEEDFRTVDRVFGSI